MKVIPFYKFALITIITLLSCASSAQTFTSSSLPIVVITTDIDAVTNQPAPIVDSPRVLGTMKIIQHPDGTRNYLTDSNTANYLNYDGRITIEIRGSSSQDLPKKSYGLTTVLPDNVSNNNVSLLGMPKENDWILNSLAFDPSLIRDYLSYNLSRAMGNYASRTVYCEVLVNGSYQGLYLLEEKIKPDTNRVNILKITSTDVAGPNLTGGYITKADKTTGGDPIAWQMPSYIGTTDFIHDWPSPTQITTEQNAYIYGQFLNLAGTTQINNSSLLSGFPSQIDIPTFVDFMLINELASNVDGYQLSTYFHKDRNGKLRAGPIWDFNLTFGNDLFQYGFDRSKTNVWQFSNGNNEGPKFWTDLFNNATFKCYLAKRWHELTQVGQPFQYATVAAFIDQTVGAISEAIIRENALWGTVPNHAQEISNMKSFIIARNAWITTNLGSYLDCNSVMVPKLVIDKINYNPGTSSSFPVSNDLEFIELKNAGVNNVNLTGYYFKELGISYQFPANSMIAAGQSIYLASNSATFQLKYGLTAFGQFTRNLSNKSQKLVLADGFGNTIDYVEYFDSAPWPNADGNGSYLELISTSLDNNLGTSWVATSSDLLGDSSFQYATDLTVYPNPVSQVLTVASPREINEIRIADVLGNVIYEDHAQAATVKVDFSLYQKGIYFLTLFDDSGTSTRKIIKQ